MTDSNCREAAWAVTNLAISGTREQVQVLVAAGVIEPLCKLLDVKDPQVVHVALDGLNNILKTYESEYAVIAEEIERVGGLDKIEALQTHENADVYDLAYEIIETFFFMNDSDEELQPKATETGFEFAADSQAPASATGANAYRF